MLMQIRERATGIFAYIIVILIIIPFAFWGIQEYFTGGAEANVATVEGYDISQREFDARLQEQRRYLKSILADAADDLFADDDQQFKNRVLDEMIQLRLLLSEVEEAGYRVSDQKIYQLIQSIPQFQKDGVFDNDTYQLALSSQRRDPIQFESQIRREEASNQYRGSIVYSAFLPGRDKLNFAALQQQERSFDYFEIKPAVAGITVSEQAIETHYQANLNQFSSQPRVKLEYIEIKQQSIADSLQISEQDLLDAYNNEPQRYRSQELRQAQHILFKLSEDATDEAVTLAFEQAQQAVDRLADGESFGSVAADLSADTFSAANNGDLGLLSRTDIDNPVFIEKLFSMQTGQVSDALRTKLGVQLIKLGEVVTPQQKSFAEVSAQIDAELRAQTAQTEFVSQAQTLEELSYEFADNLDKSAEALALAVKTTDWLEADSVGGLADYPKIRAVAFSEQVLTERINSDLLELDEGHVVVIRVLDYQEQQTQSLATVREQIEATLAQQLAVQQAVEIGETSLLKIKSGEHQFADIAAGLNAEIIAIGPVKRDSDSVPAHVLQQAFVTKYANHEQPVFSGMLTADSSYLIMRLNSVAQAEVDATLSASEWITLQGHYGRREMNAMVQSLREMREVVLYSENL